MTYQYQPPQPPQLPPTTSKTPWFKRLWVVALAAAIVGLAIGAGGATGQKSAAAAKTVTDPNVVVHTITDTTVFTATPTVTETEKPTVVKTIATKTRTATVTYTPAPKPAVNDGEYQVGQDIKSGTWRTSGGGQCYYEIDNDINGSDIVDNNNFTGHQIISVNSGEYVQFDGGCDWRRD